MILPILAALGAGTFGGYLLGRHKRLPNAPPAEATPGAIYTIGLSNVPASANVEAVGNPLLQAMAWRTADILDGELNRNAQGQVTGFTVAFKSTIASPALPKAGFTFKVGDATATVTYVVQAPASTIRFP